MKLIIVESPTKAKTLSRFLGDSYTVLPTVGHVKDLPKSTLGIDIKNNFEPEYIPVVKKKDYLKDILTNSKKADEIYLATDPDREGEAIASHVEEELSNNSKKKKAVKITRIVFHEITKGAVEEAIDHPRDIDKHLVDAQIARRVLDRLVGYNLSPLLWKKVRRGLSAGRVQSVAVRLIVEREREIEAFKSQEYWEIRVSVKRDSKEKKDQFVVMLSKIDGKSANISNKKDADTAIEFLKSANYKVYDVRKREVRKRAYPPFTTSTMTQAASRIFGWSSKKTMQIAQNLYEEGNITYHRTDSTAIASVAIDRVRGYISKTYGKEYIPEKPIFYKTKAKVAQEAHEAIRPTQVEHSTVTSNSKFAKDENKLYELIWRRFVACQMSASVYDETTIEVSATNKTGKEHLLRASGQLMKFDGYRKVYGTRLETEETVLLPDVEKDESLHYVDLKADQKFTEPPPRYNEASLIKVLEKLGIGRPSTYAPTISTIQLRNYVEKKDKKFYPTPVGVAVNDFLMKNFDNIVDYSFTAEMEDTLDKIAAGANEWVPSIRKFWDPFTKKVSHVEETAERVKIQTEKLDRECPECKQGSLVIRVGRFGKFISCERFPECKYTEKYVEKVDIKCPECGQGDVILKKTKKGRVFYGCSRYPDCTFASWKKPSN